VHQEQVIRLDPYEGVVIASRPPLLVDSIGSYVEYYVVDLQHKDRTSMLKRWQEYLRIA
jgi:hypothetical protein